MKNFAALLLLGLISAKDLDETLFNNFKNRLQEKSMGLMTKFNGNGNAFGAEFKDFPVKFKDFEGYEDIEKAKETIHKNTERLAQDMEKKSGTMAEPDLGTGVSNELMEMANKGLFKAAEELKQRVDHAMTKMVEADEWAGEKGSDKTEEERSGDGEAMENGTGISFGNFREVRYIGPREKAGKEFKFETSFEKAQEDKQDDKDKWIQDFIEKTAAPEPALKEGQSSKDISLEMDSLTFKDFGLTLETPQMEKPKVGLFKKLSSEYGSSPVEQAKDNKK
jgi:hypothetical protein